MPLQTSVTAIYLRHVLKQRGRASSRVSIVLWWKLISMYWLLCEFDVLFIDKPCALARNVGWIWMGRSYIYSPSNVRLFPLAYKYPTCVHVCRSLVQRLSTFFGCLWSTPCNIHTGILPRVTHRLWEQLRPGRDLFLLVRMLRETFVVNDYRPHNT